MLRKFGVKMVFFTESQAEKAVTQNHKLETVTFLFYAIMMVIFSPASISSLFLYKSKATNSEPRISKRN